MKNVAVLTSGNDCPGMNAALRAVVRTIIHQNGRIWGVRNGYKGLLEDKIEELNSRSVGDMIQKGGTFLGIARCKEFFEESARQTCADNLKKHGIDSLIVIGGSGTIAGALELSKLGIKVIGIPGTIENDIWGTDYTIGSDTAANTIIDAINKLRDTASAHSRIAVVEVMGRHCGWLAMLAGIAGGAEFVLIPEKEYNLDKICEGLMKSYEAGRRYSLVVVAEGVGSSVDIGKYIEEKTQMDVRVSVLGHIQRGGSPSVIDRVKASQLGEKAALAVLAGQSNVVFGFDKGKVVAIDLHDAINNKKPLNPEFLRLAELLI